MRGAGCHTKQAGKIRQGDNKDSSSVREEVAVTQNKQTKQGKETKGTTPRRGNPLFTGLKGNPLFTGLKRSCKEE